MPFTVITLKKVPDSLRGDLTRWMQEISTGVYVGNYNFKVREYLWKRVVETVGNGEATICYSCRNEIGYSFGTCNTERKVIDFDGIPLVQIPVETISEDKNDGKQLGFSNASKFHQAKRMTTVRPNATLNKETDKNASATMNGSRSDDQSIVDFVFLDIETTGLDSDSNHIIKIGAIRVSGEKEIEFHRLVHENIHIPDAVRILTGITDDMLQEGMTLEKSIRDLAAFIRNAVLVGYNISFDIRFLNKAFEKYSMGPISNKTLELIREAKRRNSFQRDYKFETTLKEYGISQSVPHRALEDAKLLKMLYHQMGLG